MGDNVPPPVQTIAYVGYDSRFLYVAFDCRDPNPAKIRAPYVDRDNVSDHLTFGYGPHFCPGAPMARAVARIGTTAFLQRFPTRTVRLVDGFEFENVPAFFETGPARLTVDIGRQSR